MFGPPDGDMTAAPLAGDSSRGQARIGSARVSVPSTDTVVTPAMLAGFPIFAELPMADLERLAPDCMMRRVPRNTQVIRAGEPSRFVYLIRSGTLSVTVSNEEGREAILVELGPGELFGEMGAIDGQPGSATVLARSPCALISLPRAAFKGCLQAHPSIMQFVLRTLIARQEEANRRITSLCLDDVSTRVIQLLRQRATGLGAGPKIEGRLNRQRIAKMVGASREMVSRVISDLKARGRITTRTGHIEMILDSRHQPSRIEVND